MTRKLTPRSRSRMSRSMSFTAKAQWKFSTFLAAGGFLLLACVVFLQVRLSGVGGFAEDAAETQEAGFVNRDMHQEHADFRKRFFGKLISAGRGPGEGLVQEEQFGKSRHRIEDALDAIDELEREVAEVSLDPANHAALLRRSSDGERLDVGAGRLDIDDAKLEELEAELDMENDELEEFESFGGNFLNEMDELKDDKGEDMDDSDFGNEHEESAAGVVDKSEESSVEARAKPGRQGGDADGQHAEVLKEVREMEERERGDDDDALRSGKGVKRLTRLGHIKTLPRSDRAEDHRAGTLRDTLSDSLNKDGSSTGNTEEMQFVWDHVLGVRKKPLADAADELSGSDQSLVKTSGKDIFSTDDVPIDEDVMTKVEELVDIEDAFLLRNQKLFKSPKASGKKSNFEAKDGASRGSLDLLNPVNNPLLTDPDSLDTGGLTKSDRAILKLLRGQPSDFPQFEQQANPGSSGKRVNEEVNLVKGSQESLPQRSLAETLESRGDAEQMRAGRTVTLEYGASEKSGAGESGLGVSADGMHQPRQLKVSLQNKQEILDKTGSSLPLGKPRAVKGRMSKASAGKTTHHSGSASTPLRIPPGPKHFLRGKPSQRRQTVSTVSKRWGSFPGIDPFLPFSSFMDTFLGDRTCTLNVFMVWNTPPWSYTVRYQRGLESLLHFHPQACVVVFSETMDSDAFQGFVQEGYRVAVVNPNLEELLEGTPSDVFASLWQRWRKIGLYYIHSSELLRLAALYKYGGIYLDADVLVLKPLTNLVNTIGADSLENGDRRLNGAVMAFEKASPFLRECLQEFTATYKDKELGWNGGGLLTRVAARHTRVAPKIRDPSDFFPLGSDTIRKYFVAPQSILEQEAHNELLAKILQDSYTVHFWNSVTSRAIPESGSLVARVLDQYCLRCDEAI